MHVLLYTLYIQFRLYLSGPMVYITAKFVVLRSAFCKLRRDFGFFCSVNHFSKGGVNANHNVTCTPSLAENYSRLLKNSEGNRDGEWICGGRK